MAALLIVDDDPFYQHLLSRVLSRQHAVSATTSGREGVRLAKELQPDLVLVDLRMPEMSGVEVIRELRENAELAQTPVILMTSVLALDGVDEALEIDRVSVISKVEFGPAEILATVAAVTECNDDDCADSNADRRIA